MRIVVTGATGFLGGRLCRYLASRGHAVIGMGRDAAKGRALEAASIRFLKHDFAADPVEEAVRAIGHADAFVHAGGLSSVWGSRETFWQMNVTGTEQVRDMAVDTGARRFVFISSPSVSFSFADQIGIRESDPLPAPVNAYAASKAEAEKRVMINAGLSPIILRPRAIYGKGDVALLPRLIRAAQTRPLPLMRKGAAVTQLTHVDDVSAAILAALDAPLTLGGRIYNIAGPETLNVCDIIGAAAARARVEVRWRKVPWRLARAFAALAEWRAGLSPGAPEPPVTLYGLGILAFSHVLDISAARRELGYEPKVHFIEGLNETFRPGDVP